MKPRLVKFQDVLAKHSNISAKRLAKLVGCSVPSVYRYLELLVGADAVISESRTPGRSTGPVPVLYTLVRRAL